MLYCYMGDYLDMNRDSIREAYEEMERETLSSYEGIIGPLPRYLPPQTSRGRDDDLGGVFAVLRDCDPPRVPTKPLASGRTFRDEQEV